MYSVQASTAKIRLEESSINDEQGEDNINEDDFPLNPGASISFKAIMIYIVISFCYTA